MAGRGSAAVLFFPGEFGVSAARVAQRAPVGVRGVGRGSPCLVRRGLGPCGAELRIAGLAAAPAGRDAVQVAVPVTVGDAAGVVLADDGADGAVALHLSDVVAGRDGSLVESADAACPGPARGLALDQPVVVAGDDLRTGALARDAARVPFGAYLARIVARADRRPAVELAADASGLRPFDGDGARVVAARDERGVVRESRDSAVIVACAPRQDEIAPCCSSRRFHIRRPAP